MHDHNKGGGGKGMMWMMILCLLFVGVLFLGGDKLSGGGYLWPILIGVFVIAHVWMMFKGHGGHGDNDAKENLNATSEKPDVRGEHKEDKHGGCCH